LVIGFLAWLAYRPHAEISADHVMGTFQMPWTVIVISMVLAVIATYFAASRPAKAIARVPIVAALAGRPPAPKKTRHLAVPIGIGFLVVTFLLLGAAGATGGGGDQSRLIEELVPGFVAVAVAIVLLAPALLGVAAAGKRSPIAIRLALRDLARYRARSGPALAAISLSTLIAVIICVASAARFGNVLAYTGPNLASSQLIVYAPNGPGGQQIGPNAGGPNGQTAPQVNMAQAGDHQRGPRPRGSRSLLVRPDLRGHATAAQGVRDRQQRDQLRRRHPHDAVRLVDDEPDAAARLRQRQRPGQRKRLQLVALPARQLHR
jgi:putative ABC transport system permease protein